MNATTEAVLENDSQGEANDQQQDNVSDQASSNDSMSSSLSQISSSPDPFESGEKQRGFSVRIASLATQLNLLSETLTNNDTVWEEGNNIKPLLELLQSLKPAVEAACSGQSPPVGCYDRAYAALRTLELTDSDSETLDNVTSDFKSALECPICLDVVKQPFKQCTRGHLTCVGCLCTLTSCPTCEAALTSEDPVCIKHLLEYLPHDCRYSVNGCKKIIEHGNEHEKFCGFRLIKCKFDNCAENIKVNDLLHHFATIHSYEWIIEKSQSRFLEFDPVRGRVIKQESSNLVHLFNNFFWINFKNNDENKQLEFTFQRIPIGNLLGDYYVKVSFTKEDMDYTYTLKAFTAEQNNDQSPDEEAEINSSPNYFCMKIPQLMLSHFVDNERNWLHINLFFFKR